MSNSPGRTGFEPATRDPERRALFDLQRRIALLEAGGGGGPGPGSIDEVWIGAAEPVDPALELWYDTDAVPSGAPGGPRGWVAAAPGTNVDQTGIVAGGAVVNGSSCTFTAEATRRYRITGELLVQQLTAAGYISVNLGDTVSGGIRGMQYLLAASATFSVVVVGYLAGVSGSRTVRLSASTSGGTLSILNATAAFSVQLWVEDIGST